MNVKRFIVSRLFIVACCAAMLALLSPLAPAQRQREPQRALTRIENTRQDWTIRYRLNYSNASGPDGQVGTTIDSGAGWAPIIPGSATSQTQVGDVKGSIDLRPARSISEFSIVDGYQCGAGYATWDIPPGQVIDVTFTVELPVVSYKTRIDERIANSRAWPEAPWSAMLATCLEPQRYIDPNDAAILGLVDRWTNGQPKKAKPYYLAKYLAGKVIEHLDVTDRRLIIEGLSANDPRRGDRHQRDRTYFKGFDIRDAGAAARAGKGSRYDLANMLCAVYRAAGLPSRIVLAVDEPAQQTTNLPMVHAWVEFFLPFNTDGQDTAALTEVGEDDGEWIPVDPYLQKRFSSRPPSLDRSWNFFGNHDQSSAMAPFAYHWVAPDEAHQFGQAGVLPVGIGTYPRIYVGSGNTVIMIMGTARRGGR